MVARCNGRAGIAAKGGKVDPVAPPPDLRHVEVSKTLATRRLQRAHDQPELCRPFESSKEVTDNGHTKSYTLEMTVNLRSASS